MCVGATRKRNPKSRTSRTRTATTTGSERMTMSRRMSTEQTSDKSTKEKEENRKGTLHDRKPPPLLQESHYDLPKVSIMVSSSVTEMRRASAIRSDETQKSKSGGRKKRIIRSQDTQRSQSCERKRKSHEAPRSRDGTPRSRDGAPRSRDGSPKAAKSRSADKVNNMKKKLSMESRTASTATVDD